MPDDLLDMHYLALMEKAEQTRTLSLKITFTQSIGNYTAEPIYEGRINTQ